MESGKETILARPEDSETKRPSGDIVTASPLVLRRGATIGRYVVLEQVGSGGMGVVYAAYDPSLDRRVAIKLVRVAAPAGSAHRERMLGEARALARLDHPNVVTVHDVGVANDIPFVAMEFVEGLTLQRWRATTRPDWRRILEVFIAAGRGLAAAHAVGLVHRDFKPDNVIISDDGRVRVLDFGLAVADVTTSADDERNEDAPSPSVAGTPAYMAPEQFGGRVVDPRSDQFSFCVSLWEALYGWRPFHGDDLVSLAASVLDGKVAHPKESGRVPAALEAALRRGLSSEPDDRYAAMADLLHALTRIADQRSPWRRAGVVVMGSTIAIAAVVFATTYDSEGPCPDAHEQLAGIWDDATRANVEAAVAQHQEILGRETWASLAPVLDAYASGWAEQRRDACEATHVRKEQTEHVWALRIACLDRRLQSLHAVVELFAEGDLAVVTSAVDAAERLPALDACSDLEQLQHQTPPPAPELAAGIDSVQASLSRASALRLAAQYVQSEAISAAALEEAVELGYAPTIAAARTELGRTLIELGRPVEARALFIDAYFDARKGEDQVAAADAATEAFSCASSRLYRLDEAGPWARHAELALEAAGDPSISRFRYLRELAELRRNEGHPREAARIHHDALALLEATEDANSLQLALAYAAYGRALGTLGDGDGSLAAFDTALATVRRRLGNTHPRVADILSGRAVVRQERGDIVGARAELEEAVQIYRRVLGDDHPSTAATLVSLASTSAGDDPHAVEMLEEVLARQRRILRPGHPDIAITEINLGGWLWKVGRADEGLALLHAGLTGLQGVYGLQHPLVGAAHHKLGVGYFAVGRREEALVHMTTALEIDRDRLARSHPTLAAALANVALLNMVLGREEDAIPLLVEALELEAERENRQHDRGITLTSALVRAYVRTGRLDEAEAALRDGERVAKESGDPAAMNPLQAEQAALLWARGEHRRAYDLAVEVRARLNPATAVEGDDTIAVLDDLIARWGPELDGG